MLLLWGIKQAVHCLHPAYDVIERGRWVCRQLHSRVWVERSSREVLGRGRRGGEDFKGQSGTGMGREVAGSMRHGKGAPEGQ